MMSQSPQFSMKSSIKVPTLGFTYQVIQHLIRSLSEFGLYWVDYVSGIWVYYFLDPHLGSRRIAIDSLF